MLSGKKTEEQILLEFLETFETNHNLRNNNAPDHIVTKEEFEEYYNNISASIDNDQYFELMMNNCWKINDGDRQPSGKAWTNKGETASPQKGGNRPGTQTIQRPATGSRGQASNSGYNVMGQKTASKAPSTNGDTPAMNYSEA